MKLQVNVADSFCERIDVYARDLGISRSAFCAMLISQGLLAYDKSYTLLAETKDLIASRLADSVAQASTTPAKTPSRARKTPSKARTSTPATTPAKTPSRARKTPSKRSDG